MIYGTNTISRTVIVTYYAKITWISRKTKSSSVDNYGIKRCVTALPHVRNACLFFSEFLDCCRGIITRLNKQSPRSHFCLDLIGSFQFDDLTDQLWAELKICRDRCRTSNQAPRNHETMAESCNRVLISATLLVVLQHIFQALREVTTVLHLLYLQNVGSIWAMICELQ